VIGAATFIICALQVYLGKIFKWGIANKGLYKYIRHPQYLALGIWGVGMVVLWPRFVVLVTLSIMFILYYFLAKDEERRMKAQYGDSYRQYISTTGMFFPRFIERFSPFDRKLKSLKYVLVPLSIVIVVICFGFALRQITLHSLKLESKDNITFVSMLPEDSELSKVAIESIVESEKAGSIDFLDKHREYLGYLMPVDYVMQGMIADTGESYHLHKKHHTFALIVDWILNPFEHLRRPPSAMMAKEHNVEQGLARRHHCPISMKSPNLECDSCPYRRVIITETKYDDSQRYAGTKLFSFNANRKPVGFIDINTQNGEIIRTQIVGSETAWKDVPTPAI
jgi:hypothetical protein